MTAGEIVAELSKVPADQVVYVQNPFTGVHIPTESLVLDDSVEKCWPEGSPHKKLYPVIRTG